jgi:hypothetical protein
MKRTVTHARTPHSARRKKRDTATRVVCGAGARHDPSGALITHGLCEKEDLSLVDRRALCHRHIVFVALRRRLRVCAHVLFAEESKRYNIQTFRGFPFENLFSGPRGPLSINNKPQVRPPARSADPVSSPLVLYHQFQM